MLYLIDSSAKNSLGHNLEYLERLSSYAKSEFLILGNRELTSSGDSRYRPTFEFGTWDFGRFGINKKDSKRQENQHSQTLRSSKTLLVIEKLVEILAVSVARYLGKSVLFIVSFSKQSRSFHRDIANGLAEIDHMSTLLISTANARELLGLHRWLKFSATNTQTIQVILRRPILDLRAMIEIPFMFFDALVHIAAILELANKVRFIADTPGLAARISNRTGVTIDEITAMGFEPHLNISTGQLGVAIAPNSRLETRYALQGSASIQDLSNMAQVSLDSNSYRKLLSTTRSLVMPYDPLRYRSRSSGIFAEALTLGILPIVPTGTSMSREIAKLNSKILCRPELVIELEIGTRFDLSEFIETDVVITFKANFSGPIILEISDTEMGVRKSTHDFFELGAQDSFLISPTKLTFLSFKSDKIFGKPSASLSVTVHKVVDRLFGACYLEGNLLNVVSITKAVSFYGSHELMSDSHSPQAVCKALGI
jgi:hypothetical protein